MCGVATVIVRAVGGWVGVGLSVGHLLLVCCAETEARGL